jgi:hypothetical protein
MGFNEGINIPKLGLSWPGGQDSKRLIWQYNFFRNRIRKQVLLDFEDLLGVSQLGFAAVGGLLIP